MKDGGIAETGTHNALLELGGIYAEMWARQSEAGSMEASAASPRIVNLSS